MADLLVAVVAFRSAETLPGCLDGILADPTAEVVVVDNSGDPATAAACRARADSARVTYLDPGENLGYARAANLALAHSVRYRSVAIVNPDVHLTDTLSRLAEVASPGPSDVVAGRLLSPRSAAGVNARPATTFVRELGKAVVGSRAYRAASLLRPDGAVHQVDQLDGALLLLAAGRWRQLGGFDERFELYYEDVDLCARVRLDGGRCLLVNEPWGTHLGGHSFARAAGTAFVALRCSRVRFARRWWRPAGLAAAQALLVSVVEFVVRSLARRAEGQRVRNAALAATMHEVRRPGSQQVLPQPAHVRHEGAGSASEGAHGDN